jgi:hypothetical protein
MATYSHSKIIKISTPNTKRGVVWHEFNRRAELAHPVWQLSSQELNPTISKAFLDAERSRSLKEFEREYLAEFVDSVVSWIEPEVLNRCVVRGRKQLPRVSDGTYVAAIDPAFRHSDFALAIAHRTSSGFIVIDRVAFWTGSKRAPLGFEWVCNEVAQIIRHYDINSLIGDQYAAPAIQQEFQKLGISYRELTFNRQTRATMFGNLMHVIQQQRIELLDDAILLRELRSLEEIRGNDGNTDVRAARGVKDDLAVVVGLSVLELSGSGFEGPSTISLGTADRPWEGPLADIRRGDDFLLKRGRFPSKLSDVYKISKMLE